MKKIILGILFVIITSSCTDHGVDTPVLTSSSIPIKEGNW